MVNYIKYFYKTQGQTLQEIYVVCRYECWHVFVVNKIFIREKGKV